MARFDKIIKNNLCLGCGLCSSFGKEDGYRISLKKNGFYSLDIPEESKRNKYLEKRMASCCPSVTIEGAGSSNVWGDNLLVRNAYSTNDEIRFRGSSGGFVTTACIYLIETKAVDAILHVGVESGSCLLNTLKVSKTVDEIKANCSSRYAPALMFDNLKQILDASNDTYALVGKSCDILCLKNFEREFPEYKGRIKITIAIFCAGMPSYNATKKIESKFNHSGTIEKIQYRGNGWPGSFTIKYHDGTENKIAYEDAWMNYLGKDIHFRCKICPDSIGTIADISVGDSWIIENGKTVFKERPGISCVLSHTKAGKQLVVSMESSGSILTEPLSESYLNKIQPNHIRKRLSSAFKIPIVRLMTMGVFKIQNLKLINLFFQYNLMRGVKESIGVWRRYDKWKNE